MEVYEANMGNQRSLLQRMVVFLILLLLLIGAVVGGYRYFSRRQDGPEYLTVKVERGEIRATVNATGTVNPIISVQVGSQVSGIVSEMYVDYNSVVKKGQLLAKIDPAIFKAQMDQAEANLRQAEAGLRTSNANVETLKANQQKAKVDAMEKLRRLTRLRELFKSDLIPKDDVEAAEAAYDVSLAEQRAVAAQRVAAEQKLAEDQARIKQTQAALALAKVNLDHTVITSPEDGTVIQRRVDVGQTVAASLSAPTLFEIARDLTKLEVDTNIDEADVGRVREGMSATFTVDAYRDKVFPGTVEQVRLGATIIQNVVTYNAVLHVDNEDLLLKPSMTANVKILADRRDNVLKIPNAALRFRPEVGRLELQSLLEQQLGSRPDIPDLIESTLSTGSKGPGKSRARVVWVLTPENQLKPSVVKLGLTDNVVSEVTEGDLHEGDKLVTAVEMNAPAKGAGARSPFASPLGGGGRR